MTGKTDKQSQAIELNDASLDEVSGGGTTGRIGGIAVDPSDPSSIDSTGSITDGTSNTRK